MRFAYVAYKVFTAALSSRRFSTDSARKRRTRLRHKAIPGVKVTGSLRHLLHADPQGI